MNHCAQPILTLLLLSSLILHPSSLARADGGAVRLREQAGDYQITVFTSPTPFRAGPVDVSVLVQDAATGECVPEARVTVRLTARETGEFLEYRATAEAATNKLFHAAVFPAARSGWWDMEVVVQGPHGPAVSALTSRRASHSLGGGSCGPGSSGPRSRSRFLAFTRHWFGGKALQPNGIGVSPCQSSPLEIVEFETAGQLLSGQSGKHAVGFRS